MNTEVRDHLLYLKGFADLITASSTADTGTATALVIKRAAISDTGYEAWITGDSVKRWSVLANGDTWWGPGGAGVQDVYLGRDANGGLSVIGRLGKSRSVSTQTAFQVRVTNDTDEGRFIIQAGGTLAWGDGSSLDTDLFRSASATAKTNSGLWALGGLVTKTKTGAPSDADLAAGMQQPGAMILDTTNSRIYFRTAAATWKYAALT